MVAMGQKTRYRFALSATMRLLTLPIHQRYGDGSKKRNPCATEHSSTSGRLGPLYLAAAIFLDSTKRSLIL